MPRLAILTPYPRDPMHPRTAMILEIAAELGYDAFLCPPPAGGWRGLDLLTLEFFDLRHTLAARRCARRADVVYVQDLRLVLAVPLIKRAGKRVVYETLDRGVALQIYNLGARRSWLRWVKALRAPLEALERRTAHRADAVVVNSEALHRHFGDRARLLYYASPFEDESVETGEGGSPAVAPPALLYLGAFSRAKGAFEMLDLRARLALPLHVFGTVHEPEVAARIDAAEDVTVTPRLAIEDLRPRLAELRARHRLLGLSLIKPVHQSYATQEANKDVDYLALGIPLIGNRRATTVDKIAAGCGAFVDRPEDVRALVEDAARYREAARECRRYYDARYARHRFRRGLEKLLRELEDG